MLPSACGLKVDWGLSRLENYGVAFVELPLMKFGVPLAGPDAYVMPGPLLRVFYSIASSSRVSCMRSAAAD